MNKFILLCIEKKISLIMVLAFFTGISIFSLSRIPRALMPDSGSKNLAVSIKYEGQSPQRIERIITNPIENALSGAAGIKSIDSVSKEGESKIYLSYNDNAEILRKIFEVRERIDPVKANFPREVHEPEIFAEGLNDRPVMVLILESPNLNTDHLREIAEKRIKKIIERVEGVSEVAVGGGSKREISVLVHEGKFYKRVSSAIQTSNISIPSGEIGNFKKNSLMVNEKFRNIEDINTLPVQLNKSEKILKLNDIADVSDYAGVKEEISRMDGEEKVSLYVMKTGGAGIIETAEKLKKASSEIKENGFKIRIIYNQAEEISNSLNNLISGIVSGSIFAVFIVFFFLRSSGNTIPIASAIPLSAMAVFIYMYWRGLSLNVMSLSGLALAAGMAVDNGIVVLEAIGIEIKKNKGKVTSGIVADAASSVFKPVFASTATTVCVFIPVVFFSGDSGRMYADLAGSVIVSLSASLIISITVIPAAAYYFLNRKKKNINYLRFSEKYLNQINELNLFKKLSDIEIKITSYEKFLHFIHAKRFRCYIALIILCALSAIIFFSIDRKIIDAGGREEIHASLDMPSGTSLAAVSKISSAVEKKISENSSVAGVTAKIEKWRSEFIIKIRNGNEKDQVSRDLKNAVSVMDLKNGYIFFHDSSGISDGEVDFDITGPDIYKVRSIAEKFSKEISNIKGASEIIYRYREGRPEIQVAIDNQRAAASGLTSGEAGEFIRSSFYGPVVSKFITAGEVDIRCRLDIGGKSAVEAIHDLIIPNDQGREIPVTEIADIKESAGITAVWHKNKEIKESITVRIKGTDQLEFLKMAEDAAKRMSLPQGYFIEEGVCSAKLRKSGAEMAFAAAMALLLVYMAVAAVYESFIIPFVSLVSIPFSIIGVAASLFIGGYCVDVTVYMGAVVLIGITVNNSIILIDSMMEIKKTGLSDAIKSAKSRIRPIMMTTLTTVCGLVPMLFGNGMWNGFAVTVISGLLVSTLLVIITLPLIYNDLKKF